MKFMVIQVLKSIAHTYQHDLKLFLYLLLWMCARYILEKGIECKLLDQPKRNILTK